MSALKTASVSLLFVFLLTLAGQVAAQSPFPIGTVLPAASILDDSRRQALFRLGWIIADGCELSQREFPGLFNRIQLSYGQAQDLHFRLPDLRGRTIIGTGDGIGPGLSPRRLGESVGEETHRLTVDEMPSHTHEQRRDDARGAAGSDQNPDANHGGQEYGPTSPRGGDQPHNIMQPSLAIHYMVFFGTSTRTRFPTAAECNNAP